VIAVDTNVLVYAHHSEAPRHRVALEALRSLAEGDAVWGLPVFVIGEFLRIVTHPRGPFRRPSTSEQALGAIDGLLGSPSVRVLAPGARFLPLLRKVVVEGRATGNLVFDAQVAAVCLEHGATTILTEDRDYARFPGLTVRGLDG
jgi:toxin-antitoxin system PIN domain toxin